MFSFQKIAVLIAVVSFVIGAFRVIGMLQTAQKQREKEERLARKKEQGATTKQSAKSVDLEACPRCGAYVPGGVHRC